MEEEKPTQEMFDHFNDIISDLKGLEKSYAHSKLMRKFLRSLPKSWATIKNAIQKAKNLSFLPLEELLGSLLL